MTKLTAKNFIHKNIIEATKDWTKKEQLELALFSAELALPYYAGYSEAPQKAIEAVKNWLEDPTEENANSAKDAADAAYYTAAAYTAAAYAAAYAAAAYDAYDAAIRAAINDEIKQKIIDYISSKGE